MSYSYSEKIPIGEDAIRSPQFFINSDARVSGSAYDYEWMPDSELIRGFHANQLKLTRVTIPNSFYNVVSSGSTINGNCDGLYAGLVWTRNANATAPTWYSVSVTPGSYTADQLIALFTIVTTSASDSSITNFAIDINTNTKKCTITFTYDTAQTVTLLRTQITDLLGFTDHASGPWFVSSSSSTTPSFTGSRMVDMMPMKKVYLSVTLPELQNPSFSVIAKSPPAPNPTQWTNTGNYFSRTYTGTTQPSRMRNVLASVPLVWATFGQMIVDNMNVEDMPMSAKALDRAPWRIQLMDQWGQVADNNGCEWSITLHCDMQKQMN